MIRINLLGISKEALKEMAAAPQVAVADRVAGIARYKNVIIVVALVVAVLYCGVRWYQLSAQLSDVNSSIAREEERKRRLAEIKKKVEALNKDKELYNKKIEIIKSLRKNQTTPVYIMDDISRRLDDYVWLSSIDMKGKTVTIRASAFTIPAMSNFIGNLNKSDYIGNAFLKRAVEAKGIVEFDLECTVKAFKPPSKEEELEASKPPQGSS